MNRINPTLFAAAFTAWMGETWPNKPDVVAIDGKASRRSHDKAAGRAPPCIWFPPSPPPPGSCSARRRSTKRATRPVPSLCSWSGWRPITGLTVRSHTELKDRCRFDTRHFIASAELTADAAAKAVRGHGLVENALHCWTLDVVFKDDLSRLRKGHGARNMAVLRHFAINLVRAVADKRSVKLRRKRAAWDTNDLASILGELRTPPLTGIQSPAKNARIRSNMFLQWVF